MPGMLSLAQGSPEQERCGCMQQYSKNQNAASGLEARCVVRAVLVQTGEGKGSYASRCMNRKGVEKTERDSSQWRPGTGQESPCTN